MTGPEGQIPGSSHSSSGGANEEGDGVLASHAAGGTDLRRYGHE
jgi:hypothetical protein